MTPQEELRILEILSEAGVGASFSVVEGVEVLAKEVARLEEMVYKDQKASDYEVVLASLDAERNDSLGILRDLCADAGRESEARGWGQLHAWRRWPLRGGHDLWWWYPVLADRIQDADHFLPVGLMSVLTPPTPVSPGGGAKAYKTCREALLAATEVIASGKWKPSMEGRIPDMDAALEEAQVPLEQDFPPTGPPPNMIHDGQRPLSESQIAAIERFWRGGSYTSRTINSLKEGTP